MPEIGFIEAPGKFSLHPSAAETGGGTGATINVNQYVELWLALNVSAISGATATLNVFIDASDDNGTTWYQVTQLGPVNVTTTRAANATGWTATLGAYANAAGFGDTIRTRWTLTGTTPSCTFSVTAVGK